MFRPPRTLQLCAAAAAVMGILVGCADSATTARSKAERVITIQRNERGGAEKEKSFLTAFAAFRPAELAPERIRSYDTRTLELLFEATGLVAVSSDRPDLTTLMESMFDEAYRRGFVRRDLVRLLHMRYVVERDWRKARALYARLKWKELEVPEVRDASAPITGPAVYDVSEDGKVLTLRPVDIVSHPTIVAVVDGGCHFSQDAETAISADAKLSQALVENAIYVDPSLHVIDPDAIAESNRMHKYKVRILYKGSAWPGLDFSSTPHFYFLKDGRVVHEVPGMDSNIAAKLREGLAKLGLS